jgi:hypothetical protein
VTICRSSVNLGCFLGFKSGTFWNKVEHLRDEIQDKMPRNGSVSWSDEVEFSSLVVLVVLESVVGPAAKIPNDPLVR